MTDAASLHEVVDHVAGRRLVVLSGAGLSTDSGIPDYRGPGSRYADQLPPLRGSSPPGVMTFGEFVSGPEAQQRYWARSHVGWTRMQRAEPNAGHRALAGIDPDLVITQNVDGLHERAGTRRLIALHGRIAEVVCLDCGEVSSRTDLHERLAALNPAYVEERARGLEVRPDGDVALEDTSGFVVAGCRRCRGRLKPHVVFFGENVPAARVQRCYDAIEALGPDGALLVVGSSLAVMSGFRFVRRAANAGTPVVIVNRGATRGDGLATWRVEAGTSEFLTALAAARDLLISS